MKRKLILVVILICILIAGGVYFFVFNSKENSKKEAEESEYYDEDHYLYEYHSFSKETNNTENIVIKYDKEGKLVYLARWVLWKDKKSCDGWNYNETNTPDLTYPEVKVSCTVTDDGLKAFYEMTDKSLEAGYLKDEKTWKLSVLKTAYNNFDTEEHAKAYLEKKISRFKSSDIKSDDETYIIIKNKRVEW